MCESKSSKGGKDANQRRIGAVQTWFVTFGFIWPSSVGWNWKPPPKDDKVVAENQLWLGFLGATFADFPLFGMRYSSWKVSTDKFSTISVQVQFTKFCATCWATPCTNTASDDGQRFTTEPAPDLSRFLRGGTRRAGRKPKWLRNWLSPIRTWCFGWFRCGV